MSLLLSLAECQAKGGNPEIAAMTYEQAIAMTPAANLEYKALGDLYMQLKKTDAAVRGHYKKYLEKNQNNELARFIGDRPWPRRIIPEAVKYLTMISGPDYENARISDDLR